MLKSTKFLKSKEGYLSSRGQFGEMVPDVFKTIDSINSKILIAKENYYLFDPGRFDINSGGRFYLSRKYSKAKSVPLKTKGDTLFISLADFHLLPANFMIYEIAFYDKEDSRYRTLAELKPYLDKNGEMEKIIRVMVKETSIKDDESLVRQEAYEEVYEALGKPSDLVFENTFRKVLKGLKKSK
jgi:hypothetical protein